MKRSVKDLELYNKYDQRLWSLLGIKMGSLKKEILSEMQRIRDKYPNPWSHDQS